MGWTNQFFKTCLLYKLVPAAKPVTFYNFIFEFQLYLQFISSEKSLEKLPQSYFKFLIELFRTIDSSDWRENSFLQIVSKKNVWKNVLEECIRLEKHILRGGNSIFQQLCISLFKGNVIHHGLYFIYLSRWLIHWEENGHKIHLKNTFNYFSLGKLNNFEELK